MPRLDDCHYISSMVTARTTIDETIQASRSPGFRTMTDITSGTPALKPGPANETKPESVPRERPTPEGDGLDPTRYGDWEKNGRCIDF
ncbi:MAG: DUF1674 domain-containing protein [Rhodanobacteraceae bacterium]